MKLNTAQIKSATDRFEAQPIPSNNRLIGELSSIYGDHTFFLDRNGLHIVEPAADTKGAALGRVVKLASWTDHDHTTLATHPPEPTGILVELEEAA